MIFWLACSAPSEITVNVNINGEPQQMGSDSGNFCEEQPDITWENHIEGFMLSFCQGCHASESEEGHGVPEGVHFDTEAMTQPWLERIGIRVLESNDMPPAGGLSESDRTALSIWLQCEMQS